MVIDGNGMAVLVTGGCGYLGSELIRALGSTPSGAPRLIRVLDNCSTGSPAALHNLPEGVAYQFVEGDILDRDTVRYALADIDVVFHLAAISKTPLSFENPAWLAQVNHWGTSGVVETAVEGGVRMFVLASSFAVYGPGGPYSESDPCSPLGPYAATKLDAERAVLAAAGGRRMDVRVARIASIHGPAAVTRFDALVNRFTYMAGTRRTVPIYGDGEQRRSTIDVRDAARALCWLADADTTLTDSKIVNLMTENISVSQIFEEIRRFLPEATCKFTEQDIRTHLSLEVDGSRARDLGWKPGFSFSDSIRDLLRLYHSFVPSAKVGDPIEFDE